MTAFSQTNNDKGQRVAVFKNGTGFFFNPMTLKAEKEGEQKGKFIIKSLPEALFGTFWFYTNGKPISSLKSYESEEETDSQKATNLPEMLYANKGKNVELTLKYGADNNTEIVGKIQDVNLQSGMIFLETTKPKVGFMSVLMNEIKAISFPTKPNTDYSPLQKQRIIEVEIDKATPQENVEMAYLQRGIGWLPSYLVHLKDDKKAQIVLRAELVNDAEDIKDATLSLVVGVPNFKYDRLVSPFVSNQTLESFLNQLNGSTTDLRYRQQSMSNMITTQSANYASMEMDIVGGGGNTDEVETQSQEDLFFYTRKGVSLPKGGRALYSLFTEEIDYKHIYEVELAQNNGYNVVYKQDNEQRNDVYHSLELKNTTDFPWTTGTAMVTQPRKTKEGTISTTSDPQVLSQDMIKYTAKTAKTMLRLTIAPDIMVKDNEQETGRKTDIKQKKIVYDLVTATATIEVKNYKDKEINLKINRTIIGEMLKTDSEWETQKRPNYYAINPVNDVTWELKLAKGESKTITYSYQFYVRK
jgi:hypothetical protein